LQQFLSGAGHIGYPKTGLKTTGFIFSKHCLNAIAGEFPVAWGWDSDHTEVVIVTNMGRFAICNGWSFDGSKGPPVHCKFTKSAHAKTAIFKLNGAPIPLDSKICKFLNTLDNDSYEDCPLYWQYNIVIDTYRQFHPLARTAKERNKILADVNQKRKQLEQEEKKLEEMRGTLELRDKEIDNMRKDWAERIQRRIELDKRKEQMFGKARENLKSAARTISEAVSMDNIVHAKFLAVEATEILAQKDES
jgi:hypothetical protein